MPSSIPMREPKAGTVFSIVLSLISIGVLCVCLCMYYKEISLLLVTLTHFQYGESKMWRTGQGYLSFVGVSIISPSTCILWPKRSSGPCYLCRLDVFCGWYSNFVKRVWDQQFSINLQQSASTLPELLCRLSLFYVLYPRTGLQKYGYRNRWLTLVADDHKSKAPEIWPTVTY